MVDISFISLMNKGKWKGAPREMDLASHFAFLGVKRPCDWLGLTSTPKP
jgi:hypothetical protein